MLRDATVCALCGKLLDKTLKFPHPMSASADHIESWATAPQLRFDPSNGQATHLVCNQRKGSAAAAEQIPAPSREW